MRARQRDYELMIIISPLRSGEDELSASIDRIRQTITGFGGEVTTLEQSAPWGRRKLAYPIRRYAEGEPSRRGFTEGFYILVRFSLMTTQLSELERSLKLNDAVLRYLLLLVEHGNATTQALAPVAIDTDMDGDEDDTDGGEDDTDDEA